MRAIFAFFFVLLTMGCNGGDDMTEFEQEMLSAMKKLNVELQNIEQNTTTEIVWEYKVHEVYAPYLNLYYINAQDMSDNSVPVNEQTLNQIGSAGWELVSAYVEDEMGIVNVASRGNNVTALKPHQRPNKVVLIFKRPREAASERGQDFPVPTLENDDTAIRQYHCFFVTIFLLESFCHLGTYACLINVERR